MDALVHSSSACFVFFMLLACCSCSCNAAMPFRVYEPCLAAGGARGLCRRETTQLSAQQQTHVAAVPKQLPVDMRFPCEEESLCKQNVDVVQPPEVPAGDDISSCSITLMPWSAFPCSFDTSQSTGVPGQLIDLCYTNKTGPSQGPGAGGMMEGMGLATNLTTDGYSNLFYGVMPSHLCSSVAEPAVVKLLLHVDFRIASGRQFDRTYSFQIGRAVAALGTCSEPSRLVQADKAWSTTTDITYLRSHLQPGMPTRFSLANMLSNTYNVPIWSTAKLIVYYTKGSVQPTLRRTLMSHLGAPHATQATALADIPDEVLPLVPADQQGFESLASISGRGDGPSHWPNVTFALPASLSDAGNIFRAQVVVVPKANGCEEFWAMTPSGNITNGTCNGVSTGEPYREIRVYVGGQLAGFRPIFYTMYTGGVDPRLWTAIVAAYTYSLPKYTFDLSPWLGVLNTALSGPKGPASTPEGSDRHSITVEITGASGSDWVLANTLLLWRCSSQVTTRRPPNLVWSPNLMQPVASNCIGDDVTVAGECSLELSARSFTAEAVLNIQGVDLIAFVGYRMKEYGNFIAFNNTNSSVFWRQSTSHDAAWFLSKQQLTWGKQPGERILHQRPSHAQFSDSSNAIITQAYMVYDWLNAGGIVDGAPFELSFNITMLTPTVYGSCCGSHAPTIMVTDGRQRHYQRLLMSNVYNPSKPACSIPDHATHTAKLDNSVSSQGRQCTSWDASCAFCSPELISNRLTTHEC